MNSWSGGVYQQAVSGVMMLNNSDPWYDRNSVRAKHLPSGLGSLTYHAIQYQKYAFEYITGKEDNTIA